MSDSGYFPFSTSEPFQKAKRTAMTYSGIVIALLAATQGGTIKLAGMDLTVDYDVALLLLLVPAAFYTWGFRIEHRRTIDRTVLREGPANVDSFDEVIRGTANQASELVGNGQHLFDQLKLEIDNQVTAFNIRQAGYARQIGDIQSGMADPSPLSNVDVGAHRVQLIHSVTANAAPERIDLDSILAILNHIDTKNIEIPAALDRLASTVRRLHRDIRRFDRQVFTWYDVVPVYILFILAFLGSVVHLAPAAASYTTLLLVRLS